MRGAEAARARVGADAGVLEGEGEVEREAMGRTM